LLVAVVALAGGGYLLVRSSDAFAVTRIIAPRTEHVTADQIHDATRPAAGVNLLRVDTAALEKRLRQVPYVRAAWVHRRFPDALEVRLEEHVPVASVTGGGGERWLVAGNGRVLGPATAGSRLPAIVPEAAPECAPGSTLPASLAQVLPLAGMLADEARWPTALVVDRVGVSGAGDVTVTLGDSSELRLGEATDLETKLTVAALIIEEWSRDGRKFAYLDLRVPSRPVGLPR